MFGLIKLNIILEDKKAWQQISHHFTHVKTFYMRKCTKTIIKTNNAKQDTDRVRFPLYKHEIRALFQELIYPSILIKVLIPNNKRTSAV